MVVWHGWRMDRPSHFLGNTCGVVRSDTTLTIPCPIVVIFTTLVGTGEVVAASGTKGTKLRHTNLSTKPNQVDARTPAPRRLPEEMQSDACAAGGRRATHGRSRAEENARQWWKRRIATETCTGVHQERRGSTPWLLATGQKTSVSCAAYRWSTAACAAYRWIG